MPEVERPEKFTSDDEIRAIVRKRELSNPKAADWLVTWQAVKYGFHTPRQYAIQWARFDNEAEKRTALAGRTGLAMPPEPLAAGAGEYFAAGIRAEDPKKAVLAYFRKKAGRIEPAGLERTW